ncbi:hypothetical protein CAPTEDRAFT_192037 [Capitella teleta]|uniref:SRCR domain-containing protein n=1 Tax=Capitella teleta TaxID=283909 RepID=R7TGF4_CAPTE|nr:hypothetical protein CAPTEDRAFT_192037 [Capitella teleta]|eukprot:ELT90651.1 hypothetical protein CAPTEDRAFT_192037 [Capitella teleta]
MNVLVLVALLLVLPVAYNASYLELSTAWMLLNNASDLEGKISVIWRNATTSTGAICFCDDGVFDLSAGNVVCRELEYDEAHLQPSVDGSGSWTIHSVHCDGDEGGLEECSWTVGARSQCQLNIVLKCYNHKGGWRASGQRVITPVS